MPNIWGQTITIGGTLPGEKVKITCSQNIGMIGQAAVIRAERPVTQLYDVLQGKLYVLTGIPQPATIQIVGLLASTTDYVTFINTYANVCAPDRGDITLTAYTPSCTSPAPVLTYVLDEPWLISIQGQVERSELGATFASTVVLQTLDLQLSSGSA